MTINIFLGKFLRINVSAVVLDFYCPIEQINLETQIKIPKKKHFTKTNIFKNQKN